MAKLTSKVLDVETGEGIPNASIELQLDGKGIGIGTVADNNGNFTLDYGNLEIASPQYSIMVSSVGYASEDYSYKTIQDGAFLSKKGSLLGTVYVMAKKTKNNIGKVVVYCIIILVLIILSRRLN